MPRPPFHEPTPTATKSRPKTLTRACARVERTQRAAGGHRECDALTLVGVAGRWLALGAVLAAIVHGSTAASAQVGGFRNAAIVWGSYDAIRSVNVDGSGRRVLLPTFADNQGDPAWTRDGHALALFASFSDDSRIYVFWPKTHKLRPLGPRASRAYEPTWSPDANRIAFTEDWGPFGKTAEATIKIVSLVTNKRTSVTKPKRNRIDVDPAWSPDGRTIALARQDHGPQTIYLTRTDGSATRRLTMGRSPSWSPDGKNLAFALGDSVYRIRVDGRARTRIVSGLVKPLVRWSPDGRKLLYATGNDTRVDAWVVDVEGTHRRRVLHDQPIEGIAWRPAVR
jgi:Tol biopolymer transport system component